MWARAQPEILGPTAPLLQKQIQHSLLGTGALTGRRGDERRREREERNRKEERGKVDAVHFFKPSAFLFLVGT